MADSDYEYEEAPPSPAEDSDAMELDNAADDDDEDDDAGVRTGASSSTQVGSRSSARRRKARAAWEGGSGRGQTAGRVAGLTGSGRGGGARGGGVGGGSGGDVLEQVERVREEAIRRRLNKDSTARPRGIIRHVVLVLDLTAMMMEKDMRPTRHLCQIRFATEYITEFHEQNPLGQISVLGMRDGVCKTISEMSANPNDHITRIQDLRTQDPSGNPSLQNALNMARAKLYHTPIHGTREAILILGGLFTSDPGDIHQTIKDCIKDRVRVSIIGMNASMHICNEICRRTNSGDDSSYSIAIDADSFRDLLLATTTPPVIRDAAPANEAPQQAAALLKMGFPSLSTEDFPSLCACHGNPTRGGYLCPQCGSKVCTLPATCPGCNLTLLLSTHLARSYHHLFPLDNFVPVTWRELAERGGLNACLTCLQPFPPLPSDWKDRERRRLQSHSGVESLASKGERERASKTAHDVPRNDITTRITNSAWDGGRGYAEPQLSAESQRYRCSHCGSHYCIDCDAQFHSVVHNCPGCLNKAARRRGGDAANGDSGILNGNGEVVGGEGMDTT